MTISKNAAVNVLKKYFSEDEAKALTAAMIVKTTLEDVAETPEQLASRGKGRFVGDVTSVGVNEYGKDGTLAGVAESPEKQESRGRKRFVGDSTRVGTGVNEYKPVDTRIK